MLRLDIPLTPEIWDEEKQEFIEPQVRTLQLEHSLVSISKWESKWTRPFLSKKEMTDEETIDYIRCMTITQNVPPEVYEHLTAHNIDQVRDYIAAPMTATTFREDRTNRGNNEIVTSELIYYWMIALNIPEKFEKWHLNRLLTLIRICNIKNSPTKKRSEREIMSHHAAVNAARRKKRKSRG